MFNPFAELAGDPREDNELVGQAKDGSREALEKLVLRHQAWIYNIALRMVFQPQDAEEVTQEVLIKAVTRLGSFKGESKFRTWLYRITANHVLNKKRRGGEIPQHTFDSYANAINDTPDQDLPDPRAVPVDVPLLVEEAMNNQCGLVNAANPCRCPTKTGGFIDAGHVDPHHLRFVPVHVRRVKEAAADVAREIENVVDGQYAAVFREHPFLEPKDQTGWLRRLLDRGGIGKALRLD